MTALPIHRSNSHKPTQLLASAQDTWARGALENRWERRVQARQSTSMHFNSLINIKARREMRRQEDCKEARMINEQGSDP